MSWRWVIRRKGRGRKLDMTKRTSWRNEGIAAVAISACLSAVFASETPSILALNATANATSEFSNEYEARFAVDGKIPGAGSPAEVDRSCLGNLY